MYTQGIAWSIEDDITYAMIGEMLPDRNKRTKSPYAEPVLAYIHKELSKKSITHTFGKDTVINVAQTVSGHI